MENLFYQLVEKLLEQGHISFANLFVDGTKIEANANRYGFVWRNSVLKNEAKMHVQIEMKLLELQAKYNCFETLLTLGDILKHLQKRWKDSGLERVTGKGRRRSELQKDLEMLEKFQERQEKYDEHKRTLDGRPSYSKTDHDATFMRMKEDHMKNGQLKPGYNLQLGIEGEFIVTAGLFSECSDTLTLLPLLNHLKEKTGKQPERLVADSGYESEENYTSLEKMGIEAYIKPTNYEINQTKKYKSNKFRTDNMPYDEESDSITCPAGNQLINVGIKHSQSKSGFVSEQSVYRCKACCECPMKAQCTKSKTGRTIQFSKSFRKFRTQSHARITTDLGKQLRMNRSIQSEGKFGVLKQDWGIRRFLRRGKENVLTETLLYAFALNVSKLAVKNQNQKQCVILHELTAS